MLASTAVAVPVVGHGLASSRPEASPPSAAAMTKALADLPVRFERNEGQAASASPFLARGAGLRMALGPTGADLAVGGDGNTAPAWASLSLVGADPGAPMAADRRRAGKVNYFVGNDPARWRSNVATFGRLRATGVYPGIDVVWHGAEGGAVEYDFVVAPGADPSPIAVAVDGAESLALDASGDLVATLGGGAGFRQHRPVAYQQRGRARTPVAAAFVLEGNQVRFALGDYDRSRPLTIDPVLAWSTYLGGTNGDFAGSVGVDGAGNVYVGGGTDSTDFPVTQNALDDTCGPDGTCVDPVTKSEGADAFVAKFTPAGDLVYATYVGGSAHDLAVGVGSDHLAVTPAGVVHLSGSTMSFDFPVVNSDRTCPLPQVPNVPLVDVDAFVFKLNASGSELKYSTCLGAKGKIEAPNGMAVDTAGNAYVVGSTASPDFPSLNAGAMGTGGRCLAHAEDPSVTEVPLDAFVSKFGPTGALIYSTCWGGLGQDAARAVAVDAAGNAYVVGYTDSASFPQKNNAGVQSGKGASSWPTGFVVKVSSKPSPKFSTYLGGNDMDDLFDLEVKDNAVYVVGGTGSTDLAAKWPEATNGAYQPAKANPQAATRFDVLVARLVNTGVTNAPVLDRLTYLGGSYDDVGWGIALGVGGVWVTGKAESTTDEPTKTAFPNVGGLQPTCAVDHPGSRYRGTFNSNSPDAFVARLDKRLTTLSFSTCLGGTGEDMGRNLALDPSGNVYISGFTKSPNDDPATADVEQPFPTTEGAEDRTCGVDGLCKVPGSPSLTYDAFVARISPG